MNVEATGTGHEFDALREKQRVGLCNCVGYGLDATANAVATRHCVHHGARYCWATGGVCANKGNERYSHKDLKIWNRSIDGQRKTQRPWWSSGYTHGC